MPPEEAAISGIDDASQVRVRLLQSGRAVHAPVLDIGLQPLDADLTAIAALTPSTGDIMVWNGSSWISSGAYATGRRNRIVNPNMSISQENANTAGTTSAYYAADQWTTSFVTSAGTITSQRVQSVTPNGSKDRYRVTITVADASLAAGEYLLIGQNIEGNRVADFRYGSASARQSILRFGFKAPAGTYAVHLINSASSRSYVALFTVSVANTDAEYSLVIPGDTSGTWLTDTGVGFRLGVTLACGSTFQGAAGWQAGNFLGTSGVTNGMGTGSSVFELYDVGLYLDGEDDTGIAPKWEMPDEAEELRACRRYFHKITNGNINPFGVGFNQTTTNARIIVPYSPPLRTTAAVSFLVTAADFLCAGATSLAPSAIALSAAGAGTEAITVDCTVTGATAGQGTYLRAASANAAITLSSRM